MTKSQLVAAVSGCLVVVSLAVSPTLAQTARRPAQPVARPTVALLDINHIFKNHTRFKGLMDNMKAEVQRAESQMKAERDAIQKMNEQLKELKAGTAEYKQLEQHVVGRMADLNAQAQLQRKEFLLKESQIYHDVYREIEQVVAYYASTQGIAVVIKINGEPVKEDNPDDVLRYINQDIVWAAQGLNITQIVLDQMNQRAISSTSRQGGAPSRTGVPVQR